MKSVGYSNYLNSRSLINLNSIKETDLGLCTANCYNKTFLDFLDEIIVIAFAFITKSTQKLHGTNK